MDYSQFLLLKEELSLILVIVILFVADLFMSPDAHKNDGKPVLNTMLPVVLLTIHTLITIVPGPVADAFGGMYHNQPIQSIVKSILSIGTLIVFLMAHEWMRRPDTAIKQGEFYILTLSTLLGMYFMISAGHFLMFFIGLETASIPMAALVAFDKYRHHSAEAGAKYILTALFSSGLLLASKIFAPLVGLLTVSTNGILRLFGIDPNEDDDQVTEEEIRMMVDAGSEKGTIDNEEKDMIQNVFEFDDLTIDEICVHRTDVDLLWVEDSIEEWEQLIHESRHSYYPVCGETVDDIIGVLDAKDYFRLRTKDRDHVMKEAIKQPYFVPENIKAATLFQNMKKTGNYFAVVLDEYGGMDGIITVRNLIEQLVGDLNDEAEIGQPSEIELISTDTWKIMGSASLDDVAEELKIKLPVDEYETFGGYIFGELGAVPDDGSQFELETDDLWIKVMRVKEHRVENTVVKKLPPKEKGEQEERKERE